MPPRPRAQPFAFHHVGEKAEAAFFLAVVVCAHIAVFLTPWVLQAPSQPRAPIVVELIAPQSRSAAPIAPQQRPERAHDPVPTAPKMTRELPALSAGAGARARQTVSAPPDAAASADGARAQRQDSAAVTIADQPTIPSASSSTMFSAATQALASGRAERLPVVPPRFDAPELRNPRAEYPRLSRRMGEQGRVLLSVFVSRAGIAEKVELQTSSGSPRLDRAALDAVARWKFVPARQGDDDVAARLLVPVVFRLDD